MEKFLSFWGKARPNPGARHSFHPLWAHSLDVAAAGAALLRARPRLFSAIARRLGWKMEELGGLWLHLLALHDIGKFSPLFQVKVPELYPAVLPWLDAEAQRILDPGHPAAGYALIAAWLDEEAAFDGRPPLFADRDWDWARMTRVLNPILGHHGRPVSLPNDDWRRFFRPPESSEAAFAYWQAVDRVLPAPALHPPLLSQCSAASWALAGVTALADWIGSNQDWFPYIGEATDFNGYWGTAQALARDAVARAGLAPAAAAPLHCFASLTGICVTPTDAQTWAATVELPDGQVLAIIEDVTGGGKTEAALMLAHRLLAEGRAAGVYLALPTMATANAMFERLALLAPRLYAEGERPSLALAHGRASHHTRFRQATPGFDARDPDAGTIDEQAESAAVAPEWLMAESRKALLADLGIGTIDQALLAVLPARYQSVRVAGLADKVLIVDEAHSYDAYVGAELDRLVAFHAAQGGSTIVLSATLPRAVKSSLVAAWRSTAGGGAADLRGEAYPCATLVAAGREPVEAPLAARADLCRTIAVTRVPDTAAALARIREAADAGACVAFIRNTVDDAVEGADTLRHLGIDADLFHARFALGDRLAIEQRVLRRFDKNSRPHERRGQVVVATQVIEQSLDLDFDLVVTDLAPIDLLLQRAGRLWRHTGRARPISGPELIVVSPDPAGPIAADWAKMAFPRASAVYADHAILWRTAREIAARPAFRIPEDVRAVIEAVYAQGEDDVPEALHRRRNEALGKAAADRAYAQSNLLDPMTGYRADVQAWQNEAMVQTRLAEESRTLRLARHEGGRLVPWQTDEDLRRAWSLSEVTAYERKLRGRHRPEQRFSALVAAARTDWSSFDDNVILLPLEQGRDGLWEGGLVDESGSSLVLSYAEARGLGVPGSS